MHRTSGSREQSRGAFGAPRALVDVHTGAPRATCLLWWPSQFPALVDESGQVAPGAHESPLRGRAWWGRVHTDATQLASPFRVEAYHTPMLVFWVSWPTLPHGLSPWAPGLGHPEIKQHSGIRVQRDRGRAGEASVCTLPHHALPPWAPRPGNPNRAWWGGANLYYT